jgi:hypothetical protein
MIRWRSTIGAVSLVTATASLVAGGVVGCDDAVPPVLPVAVFDDPPPVPLAEFCPRMAETVCAMLSPCCQASPFPFDAVKCHTQVRSQCLAVLSAGLGGGLEYDDFEAGRCLGGVPALVDACALTFDDPRISAVLESCHVIFHGSIPTIAIAAANGDPSAASCSSAQTNPCRPPAPGVRTRCQSGECNVVPLSAAGQPCDTILAPCALGLLCSSTPNGPTCVDSQLGLGAVCGSASGSSCAPNLRCDLVSGRCVALPLAGEPCDAEGACAPSASCDTSQTPPTCTALGVAGAPCHAPTDCASHVCLSSLCVSAPTDLADPLSCDGFPIAANGSASLTGEALGLSPVP